MNFRKLQKVSASRTALAVQWLRLSASTARGMGSTPGQGTEVLSAVVSPKKKKKPFSALEMTVYICDSQLGVILVDSV